MNKQQQKQALARREGSQYPQLLQLLLKCPIFNKNIVKHTKKQENVTIQRKNSDNRNCIWEGSDVRLNMAGLQSSHYMYVWRTKGCFAWGREHSKAALYMQNLESHTHAQSCWQMTWENLKLSPQVIPRFRAGLSNL